MTHRTDTTPERVRRAHAPALDGETADRVMNREYRTVEPRERDAEAWNRHPEADPAAVARIAVELARDAVVPLALTRRCPDCGAEPGVSCARAMVAACGSRVHISMRLRAEATP